MQVAVVSRERPVPVDLIGGFQLSAIMFRTASVVVGSTTERLNHRGPDQVVGLQVEHVDAVGQATVDEALFPGCLVIPEAFRLQVGISDAVEIHLLEVGHAEAFACSQFQFARTKRTEHEAALRHPFAACLAMVVIADASLHRPP